MFGIDPDQMGDIKPDPPFEVWPENWDAVQVFMACSTQWRSAPMGGVTGLDYTAVMSVMSLYTDAQRETLQRIQIMEAEILSEVREPNGKTKPNKR